MVGEPEALELLVDPFNWPICSYNFNTNSCDGSEMCGHYTQIVWRETKRLECASVVCENGAGAFITCNYDPPGSYVGEKPY
ncbi:BnaC09g32690D [Brassica napus]|uniref:BnaC09g32690D protein n=1 Tax=Brassica napus TaxID=3708 RepID=A0A078GL65_BRANA|nr:BnaC09g32690D [Brassica napus]